MRNMAGSFPGTDRPHDREAGVTPECTPRALAADELLLFHLGESTLDGRAARPIGAGMDFGRSPRLTAAGARLPDDIQHFIRRRSIPAPCWDRLRPKSPPDGLGLLRPPDDILSLSRVAGRPWPALRTPSPPGGDYASLEWRVLGCFCASSAGQLCRNRWSAVRGTFGDMGPAHCAGRVGHGWPTPVLPPAQDCAGEQVADEPTRTYLRRVPRTAGHLLPPKDASTPGTPTNGSCSVASTKRKTRPEPGFSLQLMWRL